MYKEDRAVTSSPGGASSTKAWKIDRRALKETPTPDEVWSNEAWKIDHRVSKETPAPTVYEASSNIRWKKEEVVSKQTPTYNSRNVIGPLVVGGALTAVGTVTGSPLLAAIGVNTISSAVYDFIGGEPENVGAHSGNSSDVTSKFMKPLKVIMTGGALLFVAAVALPAVVLYKSCKSSDSSEKVINNTYVYNHNIFVNTPNPSVCITPTPTNQLLIDVGIQSFSKLFEGVNVDKAWNNNETPNLLEKVSARIAL